MEHSLSAISNYYQANDDERQLRSYEGTLSPHLTTVRSNATKTRRRRRFPERPPIAPPRRGLIEKLMDIDILAVLYYISLAFLLLCLIAFIVATPVDTVIQSHDTGQFWNAIVILGAYVLTLVIALVIYIARIVSTKRALNSIPHAYFIGQVASMPSACVAVIQQEQARCADLAKRVEPPKGQVSHAGMMPPTISEGGRLVDTPYADVIAVSSSMIGSKASAFHPSFGRPIGMPLREYLGFLQDYGILPVNSVVTDFLAQYEYARFSGRLLTELEFDQYMEACRKLLVSLQIPENQRLGENGAWNHTDSFVSTSEPRLSKPSSEYTSQHLQFPPGPANSIQWNPSYLQHPPNMSEQDAFVDQMSQLSRLASHSSRSGNGASYSTPVSSYPYATGGLTVPYLTNTSLGSAPQQASSQMPPSFALHPASPMTELSPTDSYSSVLRYSTSRNTMGSNMNQISPSYFHYQSMMQMPHSSRVTSRTSSHRFLARIRRSAHLHRTETHSTYISSNGSSATSSSHGSVIIRPAT